MRINVVYFSPTHTTHKIVETLAQTMNGELDVEKITYFDLTLPGGRAGDAPVFENDDVLILGMPVYGGRVPALMEPFLAELKAYGQKAIIVAVYGNRAYEDALREMKDVLAVNGFTVIAAGAFIGEHSLSRRLAAGRPDTADVALAREFAAKAIAKITAAEAAMVDVPGDYPYKERGPALVMGPCTTEACYGCMLCANNCPTAAISMEDPRIADGALCIRCCACVKGCPVEAKLFNAPPFVEKIHALEDKFMKRQEPEMFL